MEALPDGARSLDGPAGYAQTKEAGDTIARDVSTTGESRMGENGGNIVSITGREFGSQFDLTTAEGRRGYRDAAVEFYRKNIQGKEIEHPDKRIGTVLFSRRGMGKAISSSADTEKLKMFAKLPEIIQTADVIGNPEPVKNRDKHPNVMQFWRLEGDVEIGGERRRACFSLEEHSDGKIYYNHSLEQK